MVQSIELLLDPAAESAVRADWAALAAAELPSLATHTGATNRPHVTLLATEGGLEPAIPALKRLLADVDLPTSIGAPLLFGGHRGRWVLVRQVVLTAALLELHTTVHDVVRDAAPLAEPDPQTRPDAWTPHVSIARRMPVADLPAALPLLHLEPIPAWCTAVRLWDSPSATVTELSGSS